jgi:hypothetical protein
MQKPGVLRDMAGCTKRSWPLAIEGIRYPVSGTGMTGGEKSWRPERSQAAKRPLFVVAFLLDFLVETGGIEPPTF